jgi:hypothetical protein
MVAETARAPIPAPGCVGAAFIAKERGVRTYRQALHLLIAAVVILSGWVWVNRASARPGVQSDTKTGSSRNHVRTGIDVSEFTDVDGLGFLSPEEVKPWGRLFSDETDRILLAQGDVTYVAFEEGSNPKPGDLYTVYNSSSELDHPFTGRDMGYVISFLGRVILEKEVRPGIFKTRIIESFKPMQMGDPVIPFQPISPCVRISTPQPESPDPSTGVTVSVAAAKDLSQVMGQFSVIYLNHGHAHGIHRGNLLQIASPVEADQPKEPVLPDRALGYILILEARPQTSTGLVITAKREFSSGVLLKPVPVEEILKKCLSYYGVDYNETALENSPLDILKRLTEETGSQTDLPEPLRLLSTMPTCSLN